MNKKPLIIAAIAALTLTNNASAEILDFNGLAGSFMPNQSGKNFFTTWFNDDRVATVGAYKIHSTGVGIPDGLISNNLLFISMQKAHGGPADWANTAWNGSDYIIFTPKIIITRTDGTAFNLHGFDAQPWIQGYDVLSATITGTHSDSSTITEEITLDTTPNQSMLTGNDFSSYEFTGFDGITSLSIAFTGRKELAIDNINLTQYIAPVPEPENYAMLLIGLGLLAFLTTKKQQQ